MTTERIVGPPNYLGPLLATSCRSASISGRPGRSQTLWNLPFLQPGSGSALSRHPKARNARSPCSARDDRFKLNSWVRCGVLLRSVQSIKDSVCRSAWNSSGATGAGIPASEGAPFVLGQSAPDSGVLAGLDGPLQAGVNNLTQ